MFKLVACSAIAMYSIVPSSSIIANQTRNVVQGTTAHKFESNDFMLKKMEKSIIKIEKHMKGVIEFLFHHPFCSTCQEEKITITLFSSSPISHKSSKYVY